MQKHFMKYYRKLEETAEMRVKGRILEATGLLVKAFIPGARIGDICTICIPGRGREERAEIIGFRDKIAYIMPFNDLEGIGLESEVIATGRPFMIKVSSGLRGRILDETGNPIDDKGVIMACNTD